MFGREKSPKPEAAPEVEAASVGEPASRTIFSSGDVVPMGTPDPVVSVSEGRLNRNLGVTQLPHTQEVRDLYVAGKSVIDGLPHATTSSKERTERTFTPEGVTRQTRRKRRTTTTRVQKPVPFEIDGVNHDGYLFYRETDAQRRSDRPVRELGFMIRVQPSGTPGEEDHFYEESIFLWPEGSLNIAGEYGEMVHNDPGDIEFIRTKIIEAQMANAPIEAKARRLAKNRSTAAFVAYYALVGGLIADGIYQSHHSDGYSYNVSADSSGVGVSTGNVPAEKSAVDNGTQYYDGGAAVSSKGYDRAFDAKGFRLSPKAVGMIGQTFSPAWTKQPANGGFGKYTVPYVSSELTPDSVDSVAVSDGVRQVQLAGGELTPTGEMCTFIPIRGELPAGSKLEAAIDNEDTGNPISSNSTTVRMTAGRITICTTVPRSGLTARDTIALVDIVAPHTGK
jgi:hypothetical protein